MLSVQRQEVSPTHVVNVPPTSDKYDAYYKKEECIKIDIIGNLKGRTSFQAIWHKYSRDLGNFNGTHLISIVTTIFWCNSKT